MNIEDIRHMGACDEALNWIKSLGEIDPETASAAAAAAAAAYDFDDAAHRQCADLVRARIPWKTIAKESA